MFSTYRNMYKQARIFSTYRNLQIIGEKAPPKDPNYQKIMRQAPMQEVEGFGDMPLWAVNAQDDDHFPEGKCWRHRAKLECRVILQSGSARNAQIMRKSSPLISQVL